MNAPVITFFNNKGGVGKTSLVYHLAWMLTQLDHRVVAADLDPQSNLTSAFLDDRQLESIWPENGPRKTVWGAIRPFQEGDGPLGQGPLESTGDERLALIPGDLALSSFEDDLGSSWPKCLDGDPRSFRVIAAFWSILHEAATRHRADVVLIDVGPSLGSINRAALVGSDHVVIPVAPDLFSLNEFHVSILGEEENNFSVQTDPFCLGLLKHYHSLVPLAQEARKPIFSLTHADGAFGGHLTAARDSYQDFEHLARRVLDAAHRADESTEITS